jgi:hypothetical protein
LPKIQPHPLKHRELLKNLKNFGVIEVIPKGKGSERMLVLEALKAKHGSKYKGPQMPIKCHGEGTEHSKKVIATILRRFDIDPEQFWS